MANGLEEGKTGSGWTNWEVTAIVQTRDNGWGGHGDNERWTDSTYALEVTQHALGVDGIFRMGGGTLMSSFWVGIPG